MENASRSPILRPFPCAEPDLVHTPVDESHEHPTRANEAKKETLILLQSWYDKGLDV